MTVWVMSISASRTGAIQCVEEEGKHTFRLEILFISDNFISSNNWSAFNMI